MSSRLRDFDWSGHPLGPPSSWPDELRVAVGVCLHATVPTAIYWGPDLRLIYNDAWAPIPAERHPAAIGRPAAGVWSEIWDVVGPQFDDVTREKRGFATYDQRLMMLRGGELRETYWNYSFTPIIAADGSVVGILNQGNETTDKVLTSRAQAFLLEIGDRLRDLTSGDFRAADVLAVMLAGLAGHLGLARVGYAEVDGHARLCTVLGNWRRDGVRDIAHQTFRLDAFGQPVMDRMLAGDPVWTANAAADMRFSPDEAAAYADVDICANLVVPVARGGATIAMLFLNDDHPRHWTSQEIDLARSVAERIWVALDRASATARLRESERRFSVMFGQSSVGMSELSLDGRFLRVNDSMAAIVGRPAAEIEGLPVADVTHPDDRDSALAPYADGDAPDSVTVERRYLRPDGATTWAITNITRLVGDDGAASGFFAVTTDISERKEQERIRAWLLAELNHRVKNNLSTVQAIARQTLGSAASLADFGAAFEARVMALSRAHDLLMRETWTSAALGDLVSDTLAPFALDDRRRIMIGGPEVRLSPTAAVTMTLAMHELATNAAKFGALSHPDGHVRVEWSVDRSDREAVLDVRWRETGGPIVAPPSRRGFGVRLIERGAARELGGEVRLNFSPEGVDCAFRLPLSQKITAP